jgi:hypothetical protein
VTFEFHSFRFEFMALDAIRFPAGKPGNILRGAFGGAFRKGACQPQCPGFQGRSVRECEWREACPYARIFEPGSFDDRSGGFSDWPRPFVFRVAHLDGREVQPGEGFHFDVNLFATDDTALPYFVLAFERIAREGLGPGRGRAELRAVGQLDPEGRVTALLHDGSTFTGRETAPLSFSLDPHADEIREVRVEFVTPTELKSEGVIATRPDFPVLFARVRDRILTLAELYSDPIALDIRYQEFAARADDVRMVRWGVRNVYAHRRSSRTGQVHSIGGFVGFAEYAGELTEFLPYLQLARWTGVGRHCVWGKGELATLARLS